MHDISRILHRNIYTLNRMNWTLLCISTENMLNDVALATVLFWLCESYTSHLYRIHVMPNPYILHRKDEINENTKRERKIIKKQKQKKYRRIVEMLWANYESDRPTEKSSTMSLSLLDAIAIILISGRQSFFSFFFCFEEDEV